MIIELGHFALVLALVLSLVGGVVPWVGAVRARAPWMEVATPVAHLLAGLVLLSFLSLVWAYAVSDFSVLNVAENSHSLKPLLYKITGSWGNHEGSMLLWILVLSGFGLCAARSDDIPHGTFRARALSIQSLMSFIFLLYILIVSNPFLRLSPPAPDGRGLNPVLQDPALAIHPPFLYFGYVGFSVVFSFAAAALLEKKAGADFARLVRPWVLSSWCFLTVGILLGSFWAYYELGWGGFWFWDPVENASLMPWIAGGALLHSLAALEKQGRFPAWSILLCILSFGFSLTGTFLVRSGVLTSVHAFAQDPTRGVFMLLILTLALGFAFTLFALRAPDLDAPTTGIKPASREGFILYGNLLFMVSLATIFIGTFYPVFLGVLDAGNITVGPPYYNMTLFPVFVLMTALMTVAPMLVWKEERLEKGIKHLKNPALVTVVLVSVFMLAGLSWPAMIGFALGIWIIAAAVWAFLRAGKARAVLSMAVAHAGVGILVLGVTTATLLKSENIRYMKTGEATEIAGRSVVFAGVKKEQGKNYAADRATIRIDGVVLYPERRFWPVAKMETSESALDIGMRGITYVVLGEAHPKEKNKWVVRIWVHPFAWLIWIGALLMALGGGLARWRGRYA